MNLLRFFLMVLLLNACSKRTSSRSYEDCNGAYDVGLKKTVYEYADSMPQFNGGMPGLIKFFSTNFRYAGQDNLQSRLFMEFVIDDDGSLRESGIKGKKEMDQTPAEKEVLKVLNAGPKWQPGKCHGKNVAVRMSLPMTVCLSRE